MKYLKQFLIILFFSFLVEVLHALIPLQIPASIYGLVLLFLALMTGVVSLEQVKESGKLLIEIMPLMFIPAGVGLMESFGALQEMLLPVLAAVFVSTLLVMGISGRVTQWFMNGRKEKD